MSINCSLIKQRRKELNMTGSELGDLIGVSKQTVSKYENGSVSIKNDTLKEICDILNIDMNEIYGREVDDYTPMTIAAHHDDENWTADELSEIERFKAFVKANRKQ